MKLIKSDRGIFISDAGEKWLLEGGLHTVSMIAVVRITGYARRRLRGTHGSGRRESKRALALFSAGASVPSEFRLQVSI